MNNKQTVPTSYIIIGFVIMSLVIVGILVLFYSVNKGETAQTGDVKQNSYTDPGSGETVDNPEGKSPDPQEAPAGDAGCLSRVRRMATRSL